MVAGLFHSGSGLGNQLHRYVATRVLALDNGYQYSMITPQNFKGSSFMNLNMGEPYKGDYYTVSPSGQVVPFSARGGKDLPVWKENTNYYNPEFNFIEDNTIIDGEFQDERYFIHRLTHINKWLEVEPLEMPNNLCVINFRGGEFYVYPELGLPKEYYDESIGIMKRINPLMEFEVHTDDEGLARKFFPNYKVIHNIGINWRALRYAKHAIIANSSFAILPRLLNGGNTIAPRYWARRNIKEWSMPQNYYREFLYV